MLADEDEREAPQRAHVERLHEHTLVGGPVAEEGDDDTAVAVELRAESSACRDRKAAADDPVRAENALGEIRDVHRPAHALADAGSFAPDLGHHRPRITALGEEVAVAPVRARDAVPVAQVRTNADRDGLLADVQVDGARQLALRRVRAETLLRAADQQHLLVHREQLLQLRLDGGVPCLLAGCRRSCRLPGCVSLHRVLRHGPPPRIRRSRVRCASAGRPPAGT